MKSKEIPQKDRLRTLRKPKEGNRLKINRLERD